MACSGHHPRSHRRLFGCPSIPKAIGQPERTNPPSSKLCSAPFALRLRGLRRAVPPFATHHCSLGERYAPLFLQRLPQAVAEPTPIGGVAAPYEHAPTRGTCIWSGRFNIDGAASTFASDADYSIYETRLSNRRRVRDGVAPYRLGGVDLCLVRRSSGCGSAMPRWPRFHGAAQLNRSA